MANENQSIFIKILKGIGYYILGFGVIILLEYLLKFYKALPEVGNVGGMFIKVCQFLFCQSFFK